MTAKSKINYVLILIVIICLAAIVLFKSSFEKPEISSFENIELQSLSDSSCKIKLTLKIKNNNFFSIKAKDIEMQLGPDTKGEMTDAQFNLPAHSENDYELFLSLQFKKIEDLIHLSDSNHLNSSTIKLKAKPSLWFSYMDVSEKINPGLKSDMAPQLMAQIIKQNLTLKKIEWPKEPSLSKINVQFELEFNNPYDVAIKMNGYDVKIFEDSSRNDLLGRLHNETPFSIEPKTVHTFSNSLTINPVNSFLNSAMKLLQGNLEYYILVEGNVSIGSYSSNVSTGFLFNPLNSSQ